MALAALKRLFDRQHDAPRTELREPPPLRLPEPEHPPDTPVSKIWTPARLEVEEELWGQGYLTPGGAPELLRLSVPLGLSTASSLLLLGAGAGGPAQTLATDLGVWTAGFEADPTLATLAAARIHRAGAALAKRAAVDPWDPAAPGFRAGFYHHALLLDAIRDGVPERIISAVAEALKPHGQVVLVETVADPKLDANDRAIADWCRLDGRAPHAPSPESISRVLGRLGYEIRVEEDMTARHMKLAILGWKALTRRMNDTKPSHSRAAAVVSAAEVWTRRIRLLHEGRMRVMRWHAIHKANIH